MPRFTPKVVTANALIEGDVIYLAADDSWTRSLSRFSPQRKGRTESKLLYHKAPQNKSKGRAAGA